MARDLPVGIKFLQFCCPNSCRNVKIEKTVLYRIFIFFITFLCYTAYHLSRKPLSVVKNVLVTNCSTDHQLNPDAESNDYWCNWPPFSNITKEK